MGVAQRLEHQAVALGVGGSNPLAHPNNFVYDKKFCARKLKAVGVAQRLEHQAVALGVARMGRSPHLARP